MSGPDQRDLWIATYGPTPEPAAQPSAFVSRCLTLLPFGSRILELGCGPGADAEAFARAGHTVTATDFVPAVIRANRERFRDMPNLTFESRRIDEPFTDHDGAFDAVYAHLTLHYFPHGKTQGIFAEIRRVLRPSGFLLFACKSPADPAYGKGIEIEPDMYDFHGKVRHFFSEAYARELLTSGFTDVDVQAHVGTLYRQRAGWITVVARATRATRAARAARAD